MLSPSSSSLLPASSLLPSSTCAPFCDSKAYCKNFLYRLRNPSVRGVQLRRFKVATKLCRSLNFCGVYWSASASGFGGGGANGVDLNIDAEFMAADLENENVKYNAK